MAYQPFILFGTGHLLTLLMIFILSVFLPLYLKESSLIIKNNFGYILSVIMVIDQLLKPFYLHFYFDYPFMQVLPMHMCHLTTFSIAIFLIFRIRIFYDIAFFWAAAGGTMALITPDVKLAFPHPLFISFFWGHGAILIAIGFASISLKNRPTIDSVKKCILVSLGVMTFMLLVNKVLGPPANYWYLGTRPDAVTIMNLLPSPPMHIPFLIGIGLICFAIIYLPFWIYDKRLKMLNN
ncbi:MAG: TIGR02206 family membrane protein [SAR86 cluster bacterium]|nr:TIGR02206 family membrane protein [SAR86 cluster bacterium]